MSNEQKPVACPFCGSKWLKRNEDGWYQHVDNGCYLDTPTRGILAPSGVVEYNAGCTEITALTAIRKRSLRRWKNGKRIEKLDKEEESTTP